METPNPIPSKYPNKDSEINGIHVSLTPNPSVIRTRDMTGVNTGDFSLYKETRGVDASAQCWHVWQLQDETKFKKLHRTALKAVLKRHGSGNIKVELENLWTEVNQILTENSSARNQGIWNPQGRKHLPGDGCQCYICGLPIVKQRGTHQIKHPDGGQCEHIIPVATLTTLVTIPKNEYIYSLADLIINDTNIENSDKLSQFKKIIKIRTLLLVLLFDWAHPYCNILKSDYPFFDIDYSHESGYQLKVNHETIMWILCGIFNDQVNARKDANALYKTQIWKDNVINQQKSVGKGKEWRTKYIISRYNKIVIHLNKIATIINGNSDDRKVCQYYSLQILQNTVNRKSQLFRWDHQKSKSGIVELRKIFGKSLYRQKLIKSIKRTITNRVSVQGGSSSLTPTDPLNIEDLEMLNGTIGVEEEEKILLNIFEYIKTTYDNTMLEIYKKDNGLQDIYNGTEDSEHENFVFQFYLDYLYNDKSEIYIMNEGCLKCKGKSCLKMCKKLFKSDIDEKSEDYKKLLYLEGNIELPLYLTRSLSKEETESAIQNVYAQAAAAILIKGKKVFPDNIDEYYRKCSIETLQRYLSNIPEDLTASDAEIIREGFEKAIKEKEAERSSATHSTAESAASTTGPQPKKASVKVVRKSTAPLFDHQSPHLETILEKILSPSELSGLSGLSKQEHYRTIQKAFIKYREANGKPRGIWKGNSTKQKMITLLTDDFEQSTHEGGGINKYSIHSYLYKNGGAETASLVESGESEDGPLPAESSETNINIYDEEEDFIYPKQDISFDNEIGGIFLKFKLMELPSFTVDSSIKSYFNNNYLMETYMNSFKIMKHTDRDDRVNKQQSNFFNTMTTFAKAAGMGAVSVGAIYLLTNIQSMNGGDLKNKKQIKTNPK